MHNAKINNLKEIEIFGSGKPRREILHVDDLSNAVYKIIRLLIKNDKKLKNIIEKYSFINVGSGRDFTIKEYALMLKKIINVNVKFKYNKKYPDGMKRKLLEINKIKSLGWKPKVNFNTGFLRTYKWYKQNV